MAREVTPESPPPKPGTDRPRRQRRKDARPSEIAQAALELFAERGFGATRLEDVAKRAGVAKGTLFVYFATKEDMFRAVAQRVLTANLDPLLRAVESLDRPIRDLIPLLLNQAAQVTETRVPAMVRLLISEARIFPDLAKVWHDEVVSKVLGLITQMVERAQADGELRPGDPRLHAFSIVGPMVAGMLFREVFADTGASMPDLRALAVQHATTVIDGLAADQKNRA